MTNQTRISSCQRETTALSTVFCVASTYAVSQECSQVRCAGLFHVDQSGLEGVESGEAHWGVPAESNCTVLVGKLLTLLPQQLWSILSEVLHLETYFSGLLILIKRSYKSIGQMPVREKHAKSMCRYFASAKGQRRSWMWSTPVTLECRLENGFRRVLGWYPVVPLILQIPPRRALSLHSP